MSKDQSILLDFIRFIASIFVLIHHAEQQLNVNYLSPLASFGHDAVVFFFILSGFVIAYVSKYKEKSLMEYTVARLVRMYSVVIPSILLVLILFFIGDSYFTTSYGNRYSDVIWLPVILKSLLFLNQTALTSASIPTNGPFWSISYEVWYYIIFGSFFYLNGFKKWLVTLLLLMVAGIKIIALLPIWLAGYFLYRYSETLKSKQSTGVILVLSSLILYFLIRATNFDDTLYVMSASFLFGNESTANNILAFSKRFIPDYITACLFLMLLTGLFMLSDLYGKMLRNHEKIIRVSASYSFSIYLFHFPLLIFFGEVFENGLLVIFISLLIIVLIGKYSEQKKGVIKAFIVNTSMYKMNHIKK